MTTTFKQVGAMMKAYGQTINTVPTWPSEKDYTLRVRLHIEESLETIVAFLTGDAVGILDGLIDTDVVDTGAAHTFGFAYDDAVAEVTRSNMSKLDPVTGQPNKDAGGKVVKPPTYSPANLLPFVGGLANTKPPYDTHAIVRAEFALALSRGPNVNLLKE